MSESSSEEPKIIVDSDWKEQARKEKEELERKRAEAQAAQEKDSAADGDASGEDAVGEDSASGASSESDKSASHPGGDKSDQSRATPHESGEPQLPEPSFSLLVSSLVTQAAISLGQMPDPASGQASVNKPMAKHVIDTLAMLEEKTKGNLTDEEAQLLEMMLHQLRVAFVAVK